MQGITHVYGYGYEMELGYIVKRDPTPDE